MCVHMRVCMCSHVCAWIFVRVVHVCALVCLCVRVCACMCACTHVRQAGSIWPLLITGEAEWGCPTARLC